MKHNGQRYVIGIDLGTTNSAVSYVDLQSHRDKPEIKLFNVPQLTGPGEFSTWPVLPSFLYIPGKYDISESAMSIPWRTENDNFSGAFARDHGAKVPARLVSSAKSWLCNSHVDRKARILPWGAGDDVYKVSPVEAVSEYLSHIRKAWNHFHDDDDDLFLENQLLVITVPASFNEVARDLTVEAANSAGLRNITLLEEPLAAFYSWLIRHENDWHDHVTPGELILVCDVGGGTTDFTLISLRDVDGSPRFERIAVGDHLILGGDNIDLELARRIERKVGRNRLALNKDRWKNLCHQCRQVKEQILDNKSDSEKIIMMGEGRSLIAGTVSTSLERREIIDTLMDNFFPLVDKTAGMNRSPDQVESEFGLPFEPEKAITKHLGWFLENHRKDVKNTLNKGPVPDLMMFNGGSLKSDIVRNRIRKAVGRWFDIREEQRLPSELENAEPDLAVALGAAYYGLVKTGIGVRVGSGSPRSYYLGVSQKQQTNRKENAGDTSRAICIVERGLDEGSAIELPGKQFEVLTNQPVSFDIHSSTFRSGDRCGDVVDIDESLTALPPIRTVITFGKKGKKTTIPVRIEAEYNELGCISLWCRSLVSDHRWQLQFQLRVSEGQPEVRETEVFDAAIVDSACEEIKKAFTDRNGKRQLQGLVKSLSERVGRPKEKWPMSMIRRFADELIGHIDKRKISPEHEIRWLNLAGFTLRPGFGDSLDPQRVQSMWKVYAQGPLNKKNAQVASEWWIMWRRTAGGLKSGQQRQFIQDVSQLIMPKKSNRIKLAPQQYIEVWMAVANMEKLLVKDKVKLGRALLEGMKPGKTAPQLFWALSRIGAREMLYGSADRVIPPTEATAWIQALLRQHHANPKPVAKALVQMGRKTGDRVRDIEASVTDDIEQWLFNNGVHDDDNAKALTQVIPMAVDDETEAFGESLPSGFIFHG